MKHFFLKYDDSLGLAGPLKKYVNQKPDPKDDKDLKLYYDVTDIISDKRFEQKDDLLDVLVSGSDKEKSDVKKEEYLRLKALEKLWDFVEKQYEWFTMDNEQADQQYERPMKLVLYHLVRGNLCLRISLCHYENFKLDDSDSWGNKGIEILWHGKNLAATLRDSAELDKDKRVQADLYLRLIKLNLAKYYRDYARKNRRSDFDAAEDEFKHVKHRVEEEYKNTDDPEQKRQYVLIWMDAIINIAKIHRRKYQIDDAEREILSLYGFLKGRLQIQEDEEKDRDVKSLLKEADEVISGREKCLHKEGGQPQENGANPLELTEESFEKYNDLNDYDKGRYFLLVLLEFARIQRDLHCVDSYKRAIAIDIIADQWSHELDKRIKYTPGHNIDAIITISSSLRKFIKFQDAVSCKELSLEQIVIKIEEKEYPLKLSDSKPKKPNIASLSNLIDKLNEFAKNGNMKSKTEVIKWCCLYKQEPKLLGSIKSKVEEFSFEIEESNCQLQFLNGLFSLRSENYEKAIEIFRKLLIQNQKEMQYIRLGTLGLKTRYLLANCYMSLAEFAKAEKILKELHDTLVVVQKSRNNQGVDARVEIDLGYCYMQRGAYEDAIDIYEGIYGGFGEKMKFDSNQVKRQHLIMGLNNYASSYIFSIDDEKKSSIKKKIETARRIFCYMDTCFAGQDNEKEAEYDWNPETNLLKGYYTLCTGIKPEEEPLTDEQLEECQKISKPEGSKMRNRALIKAFPNFQKACRFEEAFTSRYNLLNERGMGNKAIYRNEVERISVYIISLTKLQKLYLSERDSIEKLNEESDESVRQEHLERVFGEGFEISRQQLEYLTMSSRNLKRFLLHFPANYKISLKAAIALAEWLLNVDKRIEEMQEKNGEEYRKEKSLQDQLYRSFSYITIYEERGAGVFNTLRNNGKFRFFTAAQRGKFCALLLVMYKPIKALKEDCCFNVKDKSRTPHLVHYTSMETLKKILAGEPRKDDFSVVQAEYPEIKDSEESKKEVDKNAQKDTSPRFRINNCGYMNDVFEGQVFLKSIAFISKDIESMQAPMPKFVEKYFPQISRSKEDLLPSGSNVYIGSLSVKTDSFPMWNGYSEKESGCNIEFGEGFFDINGIPCMPKALRDYTLSKYTDQDYPLYIVQYIGPQFEKFYKKNSSKIENVDFETIHTKGHLQGSGTEAISYKDLFKILQQINRRWKELDAYLEGEQLKKAVEESKGVIRAFAADRINEIRFLFKDADYKYEGEVRVIYTDSAEHSAAKYNMDSEVPRVYVDIERELENLTIRLASRIEDATVDKYVTWLKHTKRVKKVGLAKHNRYTT